jgi:hypothetical protein
MVSAITGGWTDELIELGGKMRPAVGSSPPSFVMTDVNLQRLPKRPRAGDETDRG